MLGCLLGAGWYQISARVHNSRCWVMLKMDRLWSKTKIKITTIHPEGLTKVFTTVNGTKTNNCQEKCKKVKLCGARGTFRRSQMLGFFLKRTNTSFPWLQIRTLSEGKMPEECTMNMDCKVLFWTTFMFIFYQRSKVLLNEKLIN